MSKKYLYLTKPSSIKNSCNYYNGLVVCAESEEQAKEITPSPFSISSWVEPKEVEVTFLGIASEETEIGVILDSYIGYL